jgi:hypothetical protein
MRTENGLRVGFDQGVGDIFSADFGGGIARS